jgi:hypothetical protein
VAVFREDLERRKSNIRAHLKRLLDFENFEAERKAFEIAAKHRSVDTAFYLSGLAHRLDNAGSGVRGRGQ